MFGQKVDILFQEKWTKELLILRGIQNRNRRKIIHFQHSLRNFSNFFKSPSYHKKFRYLPQLVPQANMSYHQRDMLDIQMSQITNESTKGPIKMSKRIENKRTREKGLYSENEVIVVYMMICDIFEKN